MSVEARYGFSSVVFFMFEHISAIVFHFIGSWWNYCHQSLHLHSGEL